MPGQHIKMLLVVNGETIPEDLILEESERLARDPFWIAQANSGDWIQRIRASAESVLIDRVLEAQEAKADPRPVDPKLVHDELERRKRAGVRDSDVNLTLQRIDLQFRVERYRSELISGAPKPSNAEIEIFYRKNFCGFTKPHRFRASQIVVSISNGRAEEQARCLINTALARLEDGETFEDVHDRYSDFKHNGADTGWFPPGYLVEEFERALMAVRPGEHTGIIVTSLGFHIARLDAIEEASVIPFESARHTIEQMLTALSGEIVYRATLDALRRRAIITGASDHSCIDGHQT